MRVLPKRRPIDIFTVAHAAGVSPATVSRTINHPQQVSPQTRRRVEEAIRETGYIRNRAAQTMHGRRSGTIGLIVPTVDYAIFATLVQAFGDTADEMGFTLLLAAHGYDLAREHALLRKFLEHRVDGVALIGLDHDESTFALLEAQDTPAIAVWNHAPASRLPCVGTDNAEAGELAARHLLALGHRAVGFVFPGTRDNDRARARLGAARAVFEAEGVVGSTSLTARARYDVGDAKEAVTAMLRSGRRPSALLCGNDVIARGAIYACMSLGCRVPQDISVIGVGDFPGSADMVPALTTVHIPAAGIGREAVGQLTGMISAGERTAAGRAFAPALVIRDTTSAPGGEGRAAPSLL